MNPDAFPPSLARVIYSFTSLNCYENICPHQFFRRYITKDVKFVETEAMKRGNDVHSAFDQRISGGKPLPDGMQQWEPFCTPFDGRGAMVERKFGVDENGQPVDFWNNRAKIRVKVDLCLVNGKTAYINDWKTGKIREYPFELEVGAMVLHAWQPFLEKIVATYTWLADNKVGLLHDVSNTAATWKKCQNIIARVEQDLKLVVEGKGEFEKRQGPLCKWCNVFDCEFNQNENS